MTKQTCTHRTAGLLVGLIVATGLTACAGSSPSAAIPPVSSAKPRTTGVNSSAVTSPGSSSTTSAAPVVGAEGAPVVLTVHADAVLKEDYTTLAALAASPNARLAISGEVTQATPLYEEQIASTILTVKVTKSSDPLVPVGSSITIYRDGGLIPLKQIIPDLKNSGQISLLPSAPPANAVVDFTFMGAPQSRVGDSIVAFLQKNQNPSRADAYELVSSVHGLFTLDKKAGRYRRSGEDDRPGYQTSTGVAQTETYAERRK